VEYIFYKIILKVYELILRKIWKAITLKMLILFKKQKTILKLKKKHGVV
jgi:hypothetical protein